MATRLGDLLDDARRRTFVGRRRELASFDDILLGRSPRRVLLVHGPGGIGKTTLLLEFRIRARAAGRGAPADAHMTGLAACAMSWLTTEDLLRQVVGAAAGEVWAWLERQPFVTRGPNGLFPHDLARDVLDAEFERRWPLSKMNRPCVLAPGINLIKKPFTEAALLTKLRETLLARGPA